MGLTLFVTKIASLGLKKVGADHVLGPESSNKNEVIRAVLNPLLFLFTKRFCRQQKYQKHEKHQKAQRHPSKSAKRKVANK